MGIHFVARESMIEVKTRDHRQICHGGYQEISIRVLNFGQSALLNGKTFQGFCFWLGVQFT